MKLYEAPNNTKVRVLEKTAPPPGALETDVLDEVMFHHIDGMYSHCKDKNGNVVYLKAWTEVELV